MFTRDDYSFVRAIKADVLVNQAAQAMLPEFADVRRLLPVKVAERFVFLRKIPSLLATLSAIFDTCFWWMVYCFNVFVLLRTLWARFRIGTVRIPPSPQNVLIADVKGLYFRQLLQNVELPNKGWNWIISRSQSFPAIDLRFGKAVLYVALLSYGDVWRMFRKANRQVYLVRRCLGRDATLHAVKAMDWLLYRQALLNAMPAEAVVFMSMRDRWFFLFQSLPGIRRVLIQHGNLAVNPVRARDGRDVIPLTPYRQTTLETLYCYNRQEENAFRSIVRNIGEVRFFEPRICLTPIGHQRPSILIICCVALYAELERKIVEGIIRDRPETIVYMKPHPNYPQRSYRRYANGTGIVLIMDPFFYPDVDVVIAYHSTLATQYELLGKEVVYMSDLSLEDVLAILRRRLEADGR